MKQRFAWLYTIGVNIGTDTRRSVIHNSWPGSDRVTLQGNPGWRVLKNLESHHVNVICFAR